jgi:hypothetical protein
MRPTRERVESRKQKRLCTDAPADLRPSLKHQSDSDFRKPLEILLTVRRDLVLFEQGRSAPEAEGAPCVIMFDRIPSRALNRSKITPGRLPKPLLGTNDIKKGHHTVLIESCLQSSPPENRNASARGWRLSVISQQNCQFGVWRPSNELQKPANGHF